MKKSFTQPLLTAKGALKRQEGAGFTLIELLIVLIIIGILVTIAIPRYEEIVKKSQGAEAITRLKILQQAQEAFYLETGRYSPINANITQSGDRWKDIGLENWNEKGSFMYDCITGGGGSFKRINAYHLKNTAIRNITDNYDFIICYWVRDEIGGPYGDHTAGDILWVWK